LFATLRSGATLAPSVTIPRRTILLGALLTGLVTSSVSTLGTHLVGRRIGRDPSLSWAEVALLLGRRRVEDRPTPGRVIPGLLIHQLADTWWAFAFFGLLARWTRRLEPRRLLPLLPAWAFATSALEYYVGLPWAQPWLVMQTPYWIAYAVHLSSASAYPTSYLVRSLVAGRPLPHAGAGRMAAGVVGAGLGLLAIPAFLGRIDREIRWPFGDPERIVERRFMIEMAHHHEVGVDLARIAAQHAARRDLRDLARLMALEQATEIDVLRRWWRSWFGGELPHPTEADAGRIPGMPPPGAIDDLRAMRGAAFDSRFSELMIEHHRGAIEMAATARRSPSDPRLRLLGDQIRHAQEGQIAQMEAWRRQTSAVGQRLAGARAAVPRRLLERLIGPL